VHHAKHRAGGRHRQTVAPQDATLVSLASAALGPRNRHLLLTATLVAGVGVAGMSAAGRAQAAPQPAPAMNPLVLSGTPASSSSATAAEVTNEESVVIPPSVDATGSGRVLSWAAPARKSRPVTATAITAAAITAAWVNPLPEASVTSCFGERWGRLHAGVDIATAEGTRIRAAGAGVVVAAGPAEGYGNAVLIDHGDGFLTHYGHLSTVTVTVGQRVRTGEQIGTEGSTGHSTGPHLHFEVHQGSYKNPIEPTQWLHDRGVDIPGCVAFTAVKPATLKPEVN
jgi:murein DD-endopeptidase MepM/ murein hydrolase activator NlpD